MTDQPICHPAGPGQRALGPRHGGDHDGCEPCEARHCGGCGTSHVRPAHPPDDAGEITCPRCIGNTRTDLADTRALHGRLEDEALEHPNAEVPGGTATLLLGTVSFGYPIEQTRRILSAIDQADDRGCEGHGEPAVCAWPRLSCCRLTDRDWDNLVAGDPWPGDPVPPLLTLGTWVDTWAEVLKIDVTHQATVETEVAWLSSILHRVAQYDAWPQFAADVRAAKALLEAVLREGTRPALGVPCLSVGCGARLRQTYADPSPCTHDTQARRHARVLVAWNRTMREAGYPEALVSTSVIRAALRLARRPCETTDCDQGGRRSRWQCPACKRSYDQVAYSRAKAHHAYRASVA